MEHRFTIDVEWKDGLEGSATPRAVPHAVDFAVPAEFGGPGGQWTPEHFFAAGINTCIMATFLSIAQQSRFSFVSYRSAATATMAKTPDGLRITHVEVRPEIVVASEAESERARRMIEKAESMCPISRSVKAEVSLNPTVEVRARPS